MKNSSSIFLFLMCIQGALYGQYAPGVGQEGTTAMHKDSSAFIAWATKAEVQRGPMQIDADSLGYVTTGTPDFALGKAGANGIVSLGDGGAAVLQFALPVRNGEGWDFAVFENSFDGLFLDPPYNQGWLERVLPWMDKLVRPQGWLYVEAEAVVSSLGAWHAVKQGRAGQVHFHLMRRSQE